MSFNPNHTTPMITRDNYEEYFLLYVDNELTPEQAAAVDAFVLVHPDLKEELDLLCSTRLPEEAVLFQHKEDLLADTMQVTAIDESLLLYIDNELPDWEKDAVERKLKHDETFALQHQLVLKTKADKNEHIPYPHKKELYRSTEKRIAPLWLRVAAAAIVFAGGTVVWMAMDNWKSSVADVAVVTPKNTTQKPEASKQAEPTAKLDKPGTIRATENAVAVKKETPAAPKEKMVASSKIAKRPAKLIKKETFSNPHAKEENLAKINVPVDKKVTVDNLQTAVAKTDAPDLNKPVVTSEAAAAYVAIDAAATTTVPVQAVATTNDKSGGMKVFLRKATRFIERRTGIKTVNENDELLVGAVALKL